MSLRAGLRRHWDWVGLAAGIGVGLLDYGVFVAMGSPEPLRRAPEGFAVGLAVVFGGLGFAVGRLARARQRARRDADTIEHQLRQLEDAQRTLLQQEKLAAVGRLAAGVAHEVRNPLGVIRASAAMVREGFAPADDAHRACQFICEECDRLNALITTLLDFARPTEPRVSRVPIQPIVDRALELARPEIERRGVRLEHEAAAASPEVEVDPDLLAQVLLDLLLNAVEAVAEGGRVVVRVAVRPGTLCLEVADDGPGVAADQRQVVFEPFVTSRARGTGLGLPMALRIVEAHGGTLAYAAGEGAGTAGAGACFRVAIPRRAERAAVAAEAAA